MERPRAGSPTVKRASTAPAPLHGNSLHVVCHKFKARQPTPNDTFVKAEASGGTAPALSIWQEVRSSTCWLGASTVISPPLLPDQPPLSVRTS